MLKKCLLSTCILLLSACSADPSRVLPSSPSSVIDWVDFVEWNDTTYTSNYEVNQLGRVWETAGEVGEVTYMLDGHAGANHRSKNGDAAYLPKGTKLFAMKGYDSAFRILANGKMYEVSEPDNADTLGDFLDIKGKVTRVILQSEEDLSFVGEFSEEHAKELVDELLLLPFELNMDLNEGERVFFGIELADGTMTRSLYWPESGYINYGSKVSERMKEIFEDEMNKTGY